MANKRVKNLAPAVEPDDAVRLDQIGGGAFLNEVRSDTAANNFYYYGGLLAGAWRVNRIDKTNINNKESAYQVNNPTVTTIDAAWTNRTSLVYT